MTIPPDESTAAVAADAEARQGGEPGDRPDVAAAGFGARLKRLGSESMIYGLSSIVGRLLSYLLQPYYAHEFDPAQNGIQSVVYSYIPIIAIALYLGMDVAYMRNYASARGKTLVDRQRAFTMSYTMVLCVGGAIAALLFVSAPVLAPLVRLDTVAFRFMVAIVYGDALCAVPFAHLRMMNRALRYAAIQLMFVVTSVALNVLLIGHLHWGVRGVFAANLIGNVIEVLIFVPEIARYFRPTLLAGAAWRPLWAYALPIMPAMLAVMVVENGDRIILNYLPAATAHAAFGMSAKDVVGIYSFNYKLGVAMLLVVQMFRMAWTPFALTHAREPQAPQLYSRVLTALMLVCSAVFLGVAVLLPSLVHVPAVAHYVKPAYWVGLPIVPVILLGYVFSGMYACVTAGLYIERRTDVLPWIAGAGALLNVVICIVAESRWGMVGVAWATPASYALMAGVGAWQANRVYPVPFEWGRLAHLAAVVVALFVADRMIAARGIGPLSGVGLAAKFALLLGLPVLLAVTGFFRAGEWRAIRAVVRRRA